MPETLLTVSELDVAVILSGLAALFALLIFIGWHR